jgi:hypothetical protein
MRILNTKRVPFLSEVPFQMQIFSEKEDGMIMERQDITQGEGS